MIHGYNKKINNRYYFLRYKDFLSALEQAVAENKHTQKYFYTAGAAILDDFKEYFYIQVI